MLKIRVFLQLQTRCWEKSYVDKVSSEMRHPDPRCEGRRMNGAVPSFPVFLCDVTALPENNLLDYNLRVRLKSPFIRNCSPRWKADVVFLEHPVGL